MNIGFVSGSVSRKAGGLFFSVRSLAKAVAEDAHHSTSVFSLADEFTSTDQAVWSPLSPEIFVTLGPSALGYSPALSKALEPSQCDVLHTQGIWQGLSHSVHRWHKKTKQAYLIAPRGMLDPWALKNSAWKKRLVAILFENRHLRDAACLHALCRSEAESMRAYGLKNPICQIPNGVDLPELSCDQPRSSTVPKQLLFLGRVHPKKGLVNALHAWAKSQARNEWQLVIAGWDQGGHEEVLKLLASELDLTWADARSSDENSIADASILFSGPAFGDEKEALLRGADAFFLPSFSEGLPMSVLEGWSYALPVVMTEFCNLPEGFETNSAIQIDTDAESIRSGLNQLSEMSDVELKYMGQSGRRLVEERFTWSKIAEQMTEVYAWTLGSGSKPSSIIQ